MKMEKHKKGDEDFEGAERRTGLERREANRRLDERRLAGIGEVAPDRRGVPRRIKSKRRGDTQRRAE